MSDEQRRPLACTNNTRLHRQTGSSNLHDPLAKTRQILKAVPARSNGMLVSKKEAPPAFKVFEDAKPETDENVTDNIIHMLEKQCREEQHARGIKEKVNNVEKRRPFSDKDDAPLKRTVSRDTDDLDDSSVVSTAPSTTNGIRAIMDDICVGEDSNHARQLDKSEYRTAPDVPFLVDVCSSPEFDKDIYSYMSARETKIRARPTYMAKQPELTAEMRVVLIDWLSDVVIEYKMQQETFHLAVSMVDRTLSRFRVDRFKLQLVGATAMMIASKFEEIYPPELKEYVYLTDDTYTAKEILHMEVLMLNELKFEVSVPTSCWFAQRLAKFANTPNITRRAMEYLLDLTLLDLDFLQFRPSYIGAACLFYANLLTEEDAWTPALVKASGGMEPKNLQNIVLKLHKSFLDAPSANNKHRSIFTKYSEPSMHNVSRLTPPGTLSF